MICFNLIMGGDGGGWCKKRRSGQYCLFKICTWYSTCMHICYVMHKKRRQTEWMRERRATVKLPSAIRDQVSDLFSLFSSQRWLTVIAPSCCFSLSHSSEPLQSPREFCSLRNTTEVSQPDSFTQFLPVLSLSVLVWNSPLSRVEMLPDHGLG